MKFELFFVFFSAAIFAGYGVAFLFAPEAAFKLVTGGGVTASSAVIDLRATYGGMSLGVAALLAALGAKTPWLRAGVLGVLLIMLAMATSRALGIAVGGPANSTMWVYLALELAAAVVALALLIRPRS